MAGVLVVDDCGDMVDLLAAVLRMHDYEVVVANDGVGALIALAEGGVDLVTLDLMMPDMSGWEVLRRIREAPAMEDVPVIVLTALTDPATRARAEELCASRYMTKPFEIDELIGTINALLDGAAENSP